jgi:hypothetical protein
MKHILAAAAVTAIFAVPAYAALSPISSDQSLSNIGQCVAVEGTASVRPDPQRFGTDIDVDGEHSSFLGFIPKGNEGQFADLDSLNGQKVRITGVVHVYLGRGEVQITNLPQLTAATGEPSDSGLTHVGPEFAKGSMATVCS